MSPFLSLSEYWSTIQRLNNHGCTLILEGNYEEANRIFTLAITRYKQVAAGAATTSTSTRPSTAATPSVSSSASSAGQDRMSMSMAGVGVMETTPFSRPSPSAHPQQYQYHQEQEQTPAPFSFAAASSTPQVQEQEQDPINDDDSCFEVDDDDDDDHWEEYDVDEEDEMIPLPMAIDASSSSTGSTRTATRSTVSSLSSPTGTGTGTTGATDGPHGIRRMTAISQLFVIPYCGSSPPPPQQKQDHQANSKKKKMALHYNSHEVYSLPIVMTDEEWDVSLMDDKSFVLIYNTALCNHLYGMKLLVLIQDHLEEDEARRRRDHPHRPQQMYPDHRSEQHEREMEFRFLSATCKRSFEVAKSLYRLAISNVHSIVHGVDALCYVALFNNISHTCKTLYGYESEEAGDYDILLLKAIFWWRDTNPTASPSTPSPRLPSTIHNNAEDGSATPDARSRHPHPANPEVEERRSLPRSTQSSSRRNPIATNTNTDTDTNTNTASYADTDGEIIDAFLENVFYLLGAQESLVPAAAA